MEDDEVTTTTQVAFCKVVSSNVDQGPHFLKQVTVRYGLDTLEPMRIPSESRGVSKRTLRHQLINLAFFPAISIAQSLVHPER